MPKLRKILVYTLITILILILVFIILISPITKYLVEKYDEKYTGRQITMDWAYVNPFTGHVYFKNVKIYEAASNSVFFAAEGIGADFAMGKLLSKTYEITKLEINHPQGIIKINDKTSNIDDLIERFSSKKGDRDSTKTAHVNILDIKVNNGEFHYQQMETQINYFIRNVYLESPGKWWNKDTLSVGFSFQHGTGNGSIKGDFNVNFKTKDFGAAVIANKYDLQILDQYLKVLSNYGTFTANLDGNIKATGNLEDAEDISASGLLSINDFHLGKTPREDYLSFNRFALKIDKLSPKNHQYMFDSVSLEHPYFKYERYDHLDNLQTMFGEKATNYTSAKTDNSKFNLILEIGKYIKTLSKNFFRSDYQVKRLGIYKADIKFNDYSLNEEFSVGLTPFYFIADSISRSQHRVNASLRSGISPYGGISVNLSINPKDSTYFDIEYNLQKLPVALFNPYTITYTSFPMDRGTVELNGVWRVRNEILQSKNHLLIIDPRATKRVRKKDQKWIPMPLILSFIRERGNIINYEIPITGNLKNPKFHLGDVIIHLLENIFIKPATTPYRIEVKNIETQIEKSITVKWRMRNSTLLPNQEKFIEKMADFLVQTPQAYLVITPYEFTLKEKEYILLFEAKKKYFLYAYHKNREPFSEEDSLTVDKLSIRDPGFTHYLNNQIKTPLSFTIQDKCEKLLGPTMIASGLRMLYKKRMDQFMFYFKKAQVEKQIKIGELKEIFPFNGYSYYEIGYKGEFPNSLLKDYQKITELNEKDPRKKYEKERNKIKKE
jgi:hypothetical protein